MILTECYSETYNYFRNLPFKNLIEPTIVIAPPNAAQETPIIYHILLDAYTSSASLRKYWGYDNSELENFLRSKGFYIASKAFSNTTATQQSMATTFNMCYQYNMDSVFNNDLLSTSAYRNLINHSRIIKELTSRNYSLINLSIFDIGDSAKVNRSGVLRDATSLSQVLLEDTRFASLTREKPWVDFHTNLALFDRLEKTPALIGGSKTFVYAHINMPHDAYCDNKGNLFNSNYNGNEIKKYEETLIYTNKRLIAALKKILSESKNPPIIIIHGDHGSRMFDEHEKYTVFSAYYFPDKDYSLLYDSISLINTYRVICRKYFKENINLLADKKGCRKKI